MDNPALNSEETVSRDRSINETSRGYWSGVRRRFFGTRWALLGCAALGMLCVLALFAPLLAGNRPLIFKDEGALSFPALAAFSMEDFLWLAIPAVPAIAWLIGSIARRLVGRGNSDFPTRRVRRIAFLFLAIAVAVTAASWSDHLDRSDYRSFRDGEKRVEICVMPLIPYSPYEISLGDKMISPGSEHWLGTDPVGRDVMARLVHGSRVSLSVGFIAVLLYVLIGMTVGSLAGYFGGWTDLLLSRVIEVVICFPAIFAILAVLCFLPPSIFWIMILIGLLRWPGVARLTRGEFLRLKNEEFVTAGRAMGLSHFRVICFQILPNSLAPVLVAATFGIAGAILLESGLSFLGFGVQPPIPSWGEMLSTGKQYLVRAWWLTLFPGLAIFTAVTAFNLVGEGLRDALDPKWSSAGKR